MAKMIEDTNNSRKVRAYNEKGVFFPAPPASSTMSEMQGFSPRNLKYMRRFTELWDDEQIVQRCVAQLPWRHNICLMEKVRITGTVFDSFLTINKV